MDTHRCEQGDTRLRGNGKRSLDFARDLRKMEKGQTGRNRTRVFGGFPQFTSPATWLGLAESRRSSTLSDLCWRPTCWLGLAESRRSSTLTKRIESSTGLLGLAESRRSSTLAYNFIRHFDGWGWPRVAAQVHYNNCNARRTPSWGWPRVAAQVHCKERIEMAKIRWGWPRVAAQVHFLCDGPFPNRAGVGRESPLKYTWTSDDNRAC